MNYIQKQIDPELQNKLQAVVERHIIEKNVNALQKQKELERSEYKQLLKNKIADATVASALTAHKIYKGSFLETSVTTLGKFGIIAILIFGFMKTYSLMNEQPPKQEVKTSVHAQELVTEQKEEKKVVEEVKQEQVQPPVPVAPPATDDLSSIYQFTHTYPGSRFDDEYVQLIYTICNKDIHATKSLIAIATHETGQGKTTINNANFWGWKGGPGGIYWDPSREVMAQSICPAFLEGGRYRNMISTQGYVNPYLAGIYSGNDRPNNWINTVSWAYMQMQ